MATNIQLSRFNKLCSKIPGKTPEGYHQARCRNCNSVYRIHPSGMIIGGDNRMMDDCPHCIHKADAILDRERQEQLQSLQSEMNNWGAF